MTEQELQCANCGTTWSALANMTADGVATFCPVCHLPITGDEFDVTPVESINELKVRLDALVRGARTGGVDTDAIVRALRDELMFAAEMSNTGRQFTVQLIDLGPQEIDIVQRPLRDRRAFVSGRRGAA